MYEIEHRAVISEEKYEDLKVALDDQAKSLGEDDKEVAYYIFPNKLLKVVRNISKGTGVLSLKLTALGQGSAFKELEIPFPVEDFDTMNSICREISVPEQVIVGTQKRSNYEYHGVEIALKWSEDWGYHVEFERLISDLAGKDAADAEILEVAKHFSVAVMSEEEVAFFARAVRERKAKDRKD